MSGDELVELIFDLLKFAAGALGVLIWLAIQVLPHILKGRTGTPASSSSPPDPPVAPSAPDGAALRAWLLRSADAAAALAERAKGLGSAEAVLVEAARALEAASRTTAGHDLDGADVAYRAQVAHFAGWQDLRVRFLEGLIDERRTQTTAEFLADADAIGDALLAPVVAHTRVHGIPFPRERVVATRATDGEALILDLVGDGYPVVFVPDDFQEDLLRWPSLAHEVGHLLWLRTPGLAEEVARELGLAFQPGLIPSARHFDVRQLYRAWLEELFADTVATLQLGAPAVHGLVHAFATHPDDPTLTWAGADGQGADYEEHPPAELRVRLAAHVLREMGYDLDANAVLDRWEARVGRRTHYRIRLASGHVVEVDREMLEEHGRWLVERLTRSQWKRLAGYALGSIPGFSLTPGLRAHARQLAREMLAGSATHDDPRVAIVAAILARLEAPGEGRRIAREVAWSIVGRGAGRGGRRTIAASGNDALRDEVVDAIVLGAALMKRPSVRWRPRRAARR